MTDDSSISFFLLQVVATARSKQTVFISDSNMIRQACRLEIEDQIDSPLPVV